MQGVYCLDKWEGWEEGIGRGATHLHNRQHRCACIPRWINRVSFEHMNLISSHRKRQPFLFVRGAGGPQKNATLGVLQAPRSKVHHTHV